MENLFLDSRPQRRGILWGSWSPCTHPQTGQAGQNLPSRSLAVCWYQAPPPAPPGIIELIIKLVSAISLPCWRLLWGRVHHWWRYQPYLRRTKQIAILLSMFHSDVSVTTKSALSKMSWCFQPAVFQQQKTAVQLTYCGLERSSLFRGQRGEIETLSCEIVLSNKPCGSFVLHLPIFYYFGGMTIQDPNVVIIGYIMPTVGGWM